MSVKTDLRVDEKITQAAPFARPILIHLRRLVHEGCPEAEETIKWQMPFFLHRGKPMCHMAAFKAHCIFGFWHPAMEQALAHEGLGGKSDDAAGLFGRITGLEELPDDATLLRLIAEAAGHNESGKPARSRPADRPRKPEAVVPADLAARLAVNARAGAAFEQFSPATGGNTSSGSRRPSARKRGSSGWTLPSNGWLKASCGTGKTGVETPAHKKGAPFKVRPHGRRVSFLTGKPTFRTLS